MPRIKFKPNGTTAVAPNVPEYCNPDFDKGYDEPLTTMSGTAELVKGVVNPNKHSVLRISHAESV